MALAAIMTFSSFAGCGSKRSANSATDIEISFWVAGFGEKFMDDIIAGFNEKYPEYNAYKKPSATSTTLVNTLKLGKNDSTDIYFNAQDNLRNYRDLFMDLEEIVNEKIDGEDKSIAEKYDPSLFRSLKNVDGSINMLGWAGGIAGNIADRSLGNYLPHLKGQSLSGTQISGGQISTKVVGADGRETSLNLYNASQFEKPNTPHSVVSASDGSFLHTGPA